ncbi:MAG: nucleotidyl transferase AbiEii/AbiGii toxin family protein [Flavobacteriia bacterium]|nr:nucleotidyl transferase AbiEii/AbiGii toxin family protein [Flavobacteriia bacterium]
MIYQREIIAKAEEWEVSPNTTEKDYVLGHFLNCFFNFRENRNLFVFKGGTCLRKCYFPDYRFSEDLDFTLLDKSYLLDEKWIAEITDLCTQGTGIRFHLIRFEKKQFKDVPKGYHFKIAFWGPNHNQNTAPPPPERWHSKIEIDFSFDEELFFPINYLPIQHLYSDNEKVKNQAIPVYNLNEILTEKVRAFYQRNYKAPRDYYDVWYLLNHCEFDDWSLINKAFIKKCKLKNVIANPDIFLDEQVYSSLKKSWQLSIAHHLPKGKLPNFDDIWYYLKDNLFVNFFNLNSNFESP